MELEKQNSHLVLENRVAHPAFPRLHRSGAVVARGLLAPESKNYRVRPRGRCEKKREIENPARESRRALPDRAAFLLSKIHNSKTRLPGPCIRTARRGEVEGLEFIVAIHKRLRLAKPLEEFLRRRKGHSPRPDRLRRFAGIRRETRDFREGEFGSASVEKKVEPPRDEKSAGRFLNEVNLKECLIGSREQGLAKALQIGVRRMFDYRHRVR